MAEQKKTVEVVLFDGRNQRQQPRKAVTHYEMPESLISERLQQELGLSLNTEGSGVTVNVNGEDATSLGTVSLWWQVVLGQKTRRTTCNVLRTLPFGTDLIIGADLVLSDSTILNPDDDGLHVLHVDDPNISPEEQAEIERKEREQRERMERIARRQEAAQSGQKSGQGSRDNDDDDKRQQEQRNKTK